MKSILPLLILSMVLSTTVLSTTALHAQSGLTPARALTDSNNAAVDRSDVERDQSYLPKEAAEHLGRISLTQKVQLHLLRIGNRLVLLSVTADGATAITELTDADEVVQVLGACRRNDGKGSTAAFQQVLGGFLGGSNDGIGRGKKKTGGLNDLYTPGEDSLTGLLAAGLPIKNK